MEEDRSGVSAPASTASIDARDSPVGVARMVLLVEDNDDHAELVRRALRQSGHPHNLLRLEDGQEALSFLLGTGQHKSRGDCALILLDLRLPRVGGLEVLRQLRDANHVLSVPVVVLTTSEAEGDIEAAYEHGAHAYVVKPADFTAFGDLARDLARFWLGWNKIANPA